MRIKQQINELEEKLKNDEMEVIAKAKRIKDLSVPEIVDYITTLEIHAYSKGYSEAKEKYGPTAGNTSVFLPSGRAAGKSKTTVQRKDKKNLYT